MAISFPGDPDLDEVYTYNGMDYVWDGVKWTAGGQAGYDALYLKKTGDGSDIKLSYEAEPDTNAFTDAEKTKLEGIEAGATAESSFSSLPELP